MLKKILFKIKIIKQKRNLDAKFWVQRLLLNQQLEGLDEAELRIETEYSELQKQESELVQSLNKKYGPGNLDPNTGVFTPAPTQAEQAS